MKFLYTTIILFLSFSIQVQAQYKNWTGAVDTNWDTPGNWNPAGVPTSVNSIVIDVATNQPTLSSAATIRGMYVNGTLTIASTGTLINNGNPGDLLNMAIYGTLINNGTIRIENAATGPAVNSDIIIWEPGKIINNGSIINSYERMFVFSNDVTNYERLLNNTGGILIHHGPSYFLRGLGSGTFTNRGEVSNTNASTFGLVEFSAANFQVVNSGTMRAAGSNLTVTLNNATQSFTNEACGQVDFGTVNVSVSAGSITNNGLIQTTGSMSNSGTFSNVGVLKASSFTGITNFGLQIASSVTYPNPIFAYGDGNNYSVDDIYTDEAATIPAGTFDGLNNFNPTSTATTLYTRVGDGTCTYIVPFTYNPSPFPVKLLEFTGGSGPTSILLRWSTSEETANKGFEIMRSADSKSWERIGFVVGSGDSKSTKRYDFEDFAPNLGINYYRLRQLDLDGGNEESRIIAVRFLGENAFMVYPNPVENDLSIRMPAGTDIQKVQVLNAAGQPMNVNLNPAYGLSLATLPAGLYFVEVQTKDGGRFTEKVMKK
ncbi:T9SS type A sorting domain-containing protein [Arundinibacter roseus]|uniref:T9SS type A sorting domain-containing protein n=1 Tax=Arundinibacter roseus TaxID=2070510 RepID=A0A4R4KHG8_9BACT|nr:T9SS type A sorting domain-containing protein [Arundinibacter roseus]TDB67570.1 T9SS type A sorting domain-containing protein [Arundinibacter roseus]